MLDPLALVRRLRTAVETLDLSDDQKAKVADVLDKADVDARALAPDLQALTPREKLGKIGPFARELRQQIAAELTPEQKREFAQKIAPLNGGEMLQRMKENLSKLDLTDEQQKKISDLIDQTQNKGEELRARARQGDDVRADVRDLMDRLKASLQEILTPGQQQKLREMMQPGGAREGDLDGLDRPRGRRGRPRPGDGGGPAGNPLGPTPNRARPDGAKPGSPTSDHDAARSDASMTDRGDQPVGGRKTSSDAPNATAAHPTAGPSRGAVGTAAADFRLRTLDDTIVQLSSFKGKVLVLEFGSYTTPAFRDRVAAMEQLRADYGGRALFLVVYTHETHPSDGWAVQRNRDDHVEIEQPRDDATRRAVARQAREALHVTWPVAVDGMDDAVTAAYDGAPNAAVVIAPDGTIAARQHWADPSGLRRLIDATSGK